MDGFGRSDFWELFPEDQFIHPSYGEIPMHTPTGSVGPWSPASSSARTNWEPEAAAATNLAPTANEMGPPPTATLMPTSDTQPAMEIGSSAMVQKKRKQKAPTLRDSDWEPFKDLIYDLHITQKITLPRVVDIMERDHGFIATLRQYRSRVSKWGWDKNIKPDEVMWVAQKQQQRLLEEPGKPGLRFRIRGVPVDSRKVDRWKTRTKFEYSAASEFIPTTPAGLSYSTASNSPATPHNVSTPQAIGDTESPSLTGGAVSPALSTLTLDLSKTTYFEVPSPGPDSPTATISIPPYSTLYAMRHDRLRSEEVALRRELAQLEARHGESHPILCSCLHRLWACLYGLGKFNSAEAISRRTISVSRKIYPDDSEQVIMAIVTLGQTLTCQGFLHQAARLMQRAYRLAESSLTLGHGLTLACLNTLTIISSNTSRFKEARQYGELALQVSQRVFGESSDETLASVVRLATADFGFGNHDKAKHLFSRVIAHYNSLDEEDSRKSGNSYAVRRALIGMGDLELQCGSYESAIIFMSEALQRSLNDCGPNGESTLHSMCKLAQFKLIAGNVSEAEGLCDQACVRLLRYFGARHLQTLQAHMVKGDILEAQRKHYDAEKLITELLETLKSVIGLEDLATTFAMYKLAHFWRRRGERQRALDLLEECVQIQVLIAPQNGNTLCSQEALRNWKKEPL